MTEVERKTIELMLVDLRIQIHESDHDDEVITNVRNIALLGGAIARLLEHVRTLEASAMVSGTDEARLH